MIKINNLLFILFITMGVGVQAHHQYNGSTVVSSAKTQCLTKYPAVFELVDVMGLGEERTDWFSDYIRGQGSMAVMINHVNGKDFALCMDKKLGRNSFELVDINDPISYGMVVGWWNEQYGNSTTWSQKRANLGQNFKKYNKTDPEQITYMDVMLEERRDYWINLGVNPEINKLAHEAFKNGIRSRITLYADEIVIDKPKYTLENIPDISDINFKKIMVYQGRRYGWMEDVNLIGSKTSENEVSYPLKSSQYIPLGVTRGELDAYLGSNVTEREIQKMMGLQKYLEIRLTQNEPKINKWIEDLKKGILTDEDIYAILDGNLDKLIEDFVKTYGNGYEDLIAKVRKDPSVLGLLMQAKKMYKEINKNKAKGTSKNNY